MVSFGLIKDHPSEVAESCCAEMLTDLFHQWTML